LTKTNDIPEFFTIEHSTDYNVDGVPEADAWLPKFVQKELDKVTGFTFNNTTSLKEFFTNVDSWCEDGVQYNYSIRLGCFTWSDKKNKRTGKIKRVYTLEEEFDSMAQIFDDMAGFSMEEFTGFIYRPFVEVEVPEYDGTDDGDAKLDAIRNGDFA